MQPSRTRTLSTSVPVLVRAAEAPLVALLTLPKVKAGAKERRWSTAPYLPTTPVGEALVATHGPSKAINGMY